MKNPVLRQLGRAALALAILCGLAYVLVTSVPAVLFSTRLSKPGSLEIVRRPPPSDFHRAAPKKLAKYVLGSGIPFQVDVRGRDLTNLDLTDRITDLRHAVFDARTRWPAQLPTGFVPAEVLERNKNPGLGVRALHARGITGKGIGIGLIDAAPLLTDHVEYADRLRLYEEIHVGRWPSGARMHSVGVASIAAGKTVGVAPGAEIYFIADCYANYPPNQLRKSEYNFTWLAKAIDRLLEVNRALPRERRLRVISISQGWGPADKGFADVSAAVARATTEGVFVISTSLQGTHRLAFHGLGRDPQGDPDDFTVYRPGAFWARDYWTSPNRWFTPGQRVLVPMDHRATASPTGPEEYVSYADGGLSWSVPWLAGLYALACQVMPEITPEAFWAEALATGRTIRVRQSAKTPEVELGSIADPVALIERLTKQRESTARSGPVPAELLVRSRL